MLQDLEDVAADCLRKKGIAPDVAYQAAVDLVDFLAAHWGGQVISIPSNHIQVRALRDLEMLRRHNGTNTADLALEYGLTVRGFNKALIRARERVRRGAA